MPTWRNWQIRGHTHTRGPRVPTAGLLRARHCPKNAFCHPIPTVLLSPFYRQGTQERLPHPRAHSGSMQSPNHPAKVGGKNSGVPTRLEREKPDLCSEAQVTAGTNVPAPTNGVCPERPRLPCCCLSTPGRPLPHHAPSFVWSTTAPPDGAARPAASSSRSLILSDPSRLWAGHVGTGPSRTRRPLP